MYASRFCLVTTKIWSDGHKSPWHVTSLGSWTERVIALRSWTDRVTALRQISVTALFYLENSRKIHPRDMRACWPKDMKRRGEREREKRDPQTFGSSFYMFFLPLGLPYVNWASQECCLFYLRSSFRSSKLPLFYFHGLFPSSSFSHHHSGLLLPIPTT